jgi:3-hydroxy-9,10-secoandrosta-1,3,5(10)-triene-9,17-dione monooxygenase
VLREQRDAAEARGHPVKRYFRDVSMYRGHISAQYRWTAQRLAESHFGERPSPC